MDVDRLRQDRERYGAKGRDGRDRDEKRQGEIGRPGDRERKIGMGKDREWQGETGRVRER